VSRRFRKAACSECGGHIEYPEEMGGTEIHCPHCATKLCLPALVSTVRQTPAVKPSPKLLPQPTLVPTEILPYFPALTDDAARRIPVVSSQGDATYYLDLCDYTCTCPDFQKRRSDQPPLGVLRACKHICRTLAESPRLASLNPLMRCIVEDCAQHGHGTDSGFFDSNEKDGFAFYVTRPSEKGWLNVYAPAKSQGGEKSVVFARYGFNVFDRRWSYGEAPRNATLIKNFIFEKFATSRGQTSPRPSSGCLVIVVALLLAVAAAAAVCWR